MANRIEPLWCIVLEFKILSKNKNYFKNIDTQKYQRFIKRKNKYVYSDVYRGAKPPSKNVYDWYDTQQINLIYV